MMTVCSLVVGKYKDCAKLPNSCLQKFDEKESNFNLVAESSKASELEEGNQYLKGYFAGCNKVQNH
jgi:hypothetical protein